jgi:hypothetical protein
MKSTDLQQEQLLKMDPIQRIENKRHSLLAGIFVLPYTATLFKASL